MQPVRGQHPAKRKVSRLATYIVVIIFQHSVSHIWTNLSSPADKKRLPVLSKATTLIGEVAVCVTASPEIAVLHARLGEMLSVLKLHNSVQRPGAVVPQSA